MSSPHSVCMPDEVEYNGWCYSLDYYDRALLLHRL